jgi:hypothetical protein
MSDSHKHDWIVAVGYSMYAYEKVLLARTQRKRLKEMRLAIRRRATHSLFFSALILLLSGIWWIEKVSLMGLSFFIPFVLGVLVTVVIVSSALVVMTND